MGLCASLTINPNAVDLSHFNVIATVGQGGFGKVRAAIDLKTNSKDEFLALKFQELGYYKKERRRQQLIRERDVMVKMDSPFILQLLYAFITNDSVVFVTPFLTGGDLCFFVQNESLNEEMVRFAAAEVSIGIEQIHKAGYVYRDLKPENILLTETGHCVVSDLGLVDKLKEQDPKHNEPFSRRWSPPHHVRTRGISGTPGFMAPEVFGRSYNQLADFYGLGALIIALFTNKVPFPLQNRKVFCKSSFVIPDIVKGLSEQAQSLITDLCAYYEQDRLGYKSFWKEFRKHSFFTKAKDFSWESIGSRKSSPFRPKKGCNYDIRYQLESRIGLDYTERQELKPDVRKIIVETFKDVVYNIDPPFVLSNGGLFSTEKKITKFSKTKDISGDTDRKARHNDLRRHKKSVLSLVDGIEFDSKIDSKASPIDSKVSSTGNTQTEDLLHRSGRLIVSTQGTPIGSQTEAGITHAAGVQLLIPSGRNPGRSSTPRAQKGKTADILTAAGDKKTSAPQMEISTQQMVSPEEELHILEKESAPHIEEDVREEESQLLKDI